MNIFTSHPTNKGPTPEGENPMNAPKEYLRFVAPSGASAIAYDEHEPPHEGMTIRSEKSIFMFDASDDPMRWAKNIFCERKEHAHLDLWEVIPEELIYEGVDGIFSTENITYPEYATHELTYTRLVATYYRTMTHEELTALFEHHYKEAIDAGFDEIEAWTYAHLTYLEADFVSFDHYVYPD